MTAGVGVEFQGKTAASEEEEKHVQGTEVKVGLEEANKLHTEPPGWGGGEEMLWTGEEKHFRCRVGGWPSDDGHWNPGGGSDLALRKLAAQYIC